MADAAVDAGARAVLTFLEAEFASWDVTRLAAPPAPQMPADAVYFRIEDEGELLGTVGAMPDFLSSQPTTALVERLHMDDVPAEVRRAGAGSCVMLATGKPPTAIRL
jgi:hypothetical protein